MCGLRTISLISVVFFAWSSVAVVVAQNYGYGQPQWRTGNTHNPGSNLYGAQGQNYNPIHHRTVASHYNGVQSGLAHQRLPQYPQQPNDYEIYQRHVQPIVERDQQRNWKPTTNYSCRESNRNYDCIFWDVHITAETLQTHDVIFGNDDPRLNTQRYLTFKNSFVRVLPEAFLRPFPQVELVNLEDLQIQQITPNAFADANTLDQLYMSFNAIEHLPPFAFSNMPSLQVLLLDRNNLKNLSSNCFYNLPNISALSISHNKLETIDDNTFQAIVNLTEIDVSSNKLTYFDLSRLPGLIKANVSYNQLTTLAVPREVYELDASYNRINIISGAYNTVLSILNLQHNNLTDFAWLQNYPKLTTLDLSHNELEMIPGEQFVNLKRLVKLNLSHNRLVGINLSRKPLPALKLLDLSHNQLVYVENSQPKFDTVDFLYLDHNSIVTLKLSANHAVKNLTLSHNDWDCKALSEMFQNMNLPVLDRDQYCKYYYKLVNGFCCKESEIPYLDRLIEYIKIISLAEIIWRPQGCSADDALASVRNFSDFMAQQGDVSEELLQLQSAISMLQSEIRNLTQTYYTQPQSVLNLRAVIENNLRRYHLSTDRLAPAISHLKKMFTHLKDRHAFKWREAKARREESNDKRMKVEKLEQENATFQNQSEFKRARYNEMRQQIRMKKFKVNQLEIRTRNLSNDD